MTISAYGLFIYKNPAENRAIVYSVYETDNPTEVVVIWKVTSVMRNAPPVRMDHPE